MQVVAHRVCAVEQSRDSFRAIEASNGLISLRLNAEDFDEGAHLEESHELHWRLWGRIAGDGCRDPS